MTGTDAAGTGIAGRATPGGATPGWSTPGWAAAAEAWTVRALSDAGIDVTGRFTEHRTTPWSTVWTVRTGRGTVWFKQNRPGLAAEGPVQAVLAGIAPQMVDSPLAVEPSRGWMLTWNVGATVLHAAPSGRGIEPDILIPLLHDYAHLQRLSSDRERELRGAGLPAADPRHAVVAARRQASHLAGLPAGDPRRITAEQREQVITALPALDQAGRALLSGPVPMTFDHGDLWPGNSLHPRSEGGRYRLFDFAEALWAHPFGSLIMLVQECRYRWDITAPADVIDCRDPRIRAIFDAYLSCWDDLADLRRLRVLAQHALTVATVHRSMVWLRALRGADDAALHRHGQVPWAWLQDATRPFLL